MRNVIIYCDTRKSTEMTNEPVTHGKSNQIRTSFNVRCQRSRVATRMKIQNASSFVGIAHHSQFSTRSDIRSSYSEPAEAENHKTKNPRQIAEQPQLESA